MTGPGGLAGGRTCVWALVLCLAGASQASAQETIQPAEIPPAGYNGLQYIDTKGCVFLRAGTEAGTIWVPRVTAGGKQLCGYPPSGQRVPVAGETVAGETGSGEGTFEAAEAAPDAGADTKAAVASPAPGKEPADASRFVVALGSFGFASNVDKAAAGAEALGYPAIKGKLTGGEQGLVTVFAGPFDSKAEAEVARQKLRNAGFPDAILMAY